MKDSVIESPSAFIEDHLPESCHVCLIYESEEQRQKIIAEYIAEGLRRGEVVRYFTDKTKPDIIRSWLTELGVEISEAEKNGSFAVSKADNAYCPDGIFEPQTMIDRSVNRYDQAEKAGYTGSRACGEMTWVLNGIPGSDRFLEYETLLNSVVSAFPHSGMCQYNARLFDGATLFKILQIHPFMIAQGQIIRNPFYTKPGELNATLNTNR